MRVSCEFILCRQGQAHLLKIALSPFSLFPPQWVDFLWAPWAHTPGRPIIPGIRIIWTCPEPTSLPSSKDLPPRHLLASCLLRSSFLSQQEADLRCPTLTHLSPPPDGLPEVPASLTAGIPEGLSLCLHCMMAGYVMGAKDHSVHWMKLWGWRETLPLVLAKGH